MERWNMVEPYWEYNRHTGYGQAVDISVKNSTVIVSCLCESFVCY